MKKLKPTIVLTVICLSVALLLSVINTFTAPIIKERANAAANAALIEVLPNGSSFEKLDSTEGLPAAITGVWKAPEGYVFEASVKGYNSGLVVMVGVDSTGKVAGTKCTASNETYGFEGKLDGVYNGKELQGLEVIIAAGASKNSMTSKGYYSAVQAALQAYGILGGEEVDLRTPEQILQDNCNSALKTEGKTFTRWFSSYAALGESEVYLTDGGVVVKVGESFVGYVNGEPVEGPDADTVSAASTAYGIYAAATKVDLASVSGLGDTVKSIYALEDGSYMFSLTTTGFEWAKAPIVIELIIDKDGAISSCVTVSHAESGGYGSICGEPEYYEQYNGKTAENYNEIPNITATAPNADGTSGGATQTSVGYKRAIRQAFAAYEILKGEA